MDFMPFGIWEILLVLVVALLVVGPRRVPEIARTLGEAIRQIKRASAELSRSITEEIDSEVKNVKRDVHEANINITSTLKNVTEIQAKTDTTSTGTVSGEKHPMTSPPPTEEED